VRTDRRGDVPPRVTPYDDARDKERDERTNTQSAGEGATAMSTDTMMMVARVEQEYRMEQAAKANRLREAEKIQGRNRAGLFARRTRNAK